jgi:pimeloyl-ACP methyl ester carboxylesterase
MNFESRLIAIPASEFVPAHRLHALVWNSDAIQTVLLMHGLTRNARDFDFLAETLSKDCRVIALDMPGRGLSDGLNEPAHYHYGTYVTDTLNALFQLGVSRTHWIGTSMGGIIGMMLANAAPQIIQTLTLNDIGCMIPANGLSRILSYAGVNTCFATRIDAEAAMRQNCAPFGITDERHWQHLFKHGIREHVGGFSFTYDPAITASFPKDKPIQDVNLWALWEKIQPIPTLLLRGESSDILTRETALSMKEQHPQLQFEEISGCGHAPALMNDQQKALIQNWIRARS